MTAPETFRQFLAGTGLSESEACALALACCGTACTTPITYTVDPDAGLVYEQARPHLGDRVSRGLTVDDPGRRNSLPPGRQYPISAVIADGVAGHQDTLESECQGYTPERRAAALARLAGPDDRGWGAWDWARAALHGERYMDLATQDHILWLVIGAKVAAEGRGAVPACVWVKLGVAE